MGESINVNDATPADLAVADQLFKTAMEAVRSLDESYDAYRRHIGDLEHPMMMPKQILDWINELDSDSLRLLVICQAITFYNAANGIKGPDLSHLEES